MCSADPATCEKSGPLSMFVGWDSGRRRSTRVTSSRPLHSTVTRSVDTHLKPQEKVTGLAGSAVQHRDSTYATCFFNSAPHMTNISTLISCLIHLLLYTHLFKTLPPSPCYARDTRSFQGPAKAQLHDLHPLQRKMPVPTGPRYVEECSEQRQSSQEAKELAVCSTVLLRPTLAMPVHVVAPTLPSRLYNTVVLQVKVSEPVALCHWGR